MEGKTSVREGVVKVELYRRIKPLMLFWITKLWRTRKFAVPSHFDRLGSFCAKSVNSVKCPAFNAFGFLASPFLHEFVELWEKGSQVSAVNFS